MDAQNNDHVALWKSACNGNESAWSWLVMFNHYAHAIDDIVDDQMAGKPRPPEFIISTFAQGCMLFSHPFYLANISCLQRTMLLVTNAYADSVKWEQSDKKHQRAFADVLRFCGNEMVFTVAIICGGYEHVRSISSKLREDSWQGHHNKDGASI